MDNITFISTMIVLVGNSCFACFSTWQNYIGQRALKQFSTFNSSNKETFSRILKEKNETYEHIYRLHNTVVELDQVLSSLLTPSCDSETRLTSMEHESLSISYVYSLARLFAWIEKKKHTCSAVSAMHIGGFKEQLEQISYFLHTTNSYLSFSFLKQKTIGEIMMKDGKENITEFGKQSHTLFEDPISKAHLLVTDLALKKHHFANLQSLEPYVMSIFLTNMLNEVSFCNLWKVNRLYQIKAYYQHEKIYCRLHSKVAKSFAKRILAKEEQWKRLKDELELILLEKEDELIQDNEDNHQYFKAAKEDDLTHFMEKLLNIYRHDLFHAYLEKEASAVIEMHQLVRHLLRTTEKILKEDAFLKEKLHKHVFESQIT